MLCTREPSASIRCGGGAFGFGTWFSPILWVCGAFNTFQYHLRGKTTVTATGTCLYKMEPSKGILEIINFSVENQVEFSPEFCSVFFTFFFLALSVSSIIECKAQGIQKTLQFYGGENEFHWRNICTTGVTSWLSLFDSFCMFRWSLKSLSEHH